MSSESQSFKSFKEHENIAAEAMIANETFAILHQKVKQCYQREG